MKLKRADATNFGSYRTLSFDFSNKGLALVYGPTGSGKSTIQDIPAWALFGITAKDGNADDVRSWTNPQEMTEVSLEVTTNDGAEIRVIRKRGKQNQNDLFWIENDEAYRGKDITETQVLLEKRLGVTAELYTTAAYFHEFTASSTFFLAKAKDRRKVFEQIANLEFPTKLAANLSTSKKSTKATLQGVTRRSDEVKGQVRELQASLVRVTNSFDAWRKTHAAKLENLDILQKNFVEESTRKRQAALEKFERFEASRALDIDNILDRLETLNEVNFSESETDEKIKALSLKAASLNNMRCKACSAPKESQAKEKIMEQIFALQQKKSEAVNRKVQTSMFKKDLERLMNASNPHAVTLAADEVNYHADALEAARREVNPHDTALTETRADLINAERVYKTLTDDAAVLSYKISSLDVLQDLSETLRGDLVSRTIQNIQNDTNRLLDTYFDSEIKVEFELGDADSVEVSIQKTGYDCVYKQLSKGQRGLLKLCFVLSVMKAASNNAGVHFNTVFLDEALDGLDSNLKVKAFGVFQELAKTHESVVLIDHSPELQSMFDERYKVEMVDDESRITHES